MGLISIVRTYSAAIQNGRSLESVSKHARGELDELDQEIAGTGDGRDGIVGEAIDVIACMLDVIFVHAPETTNEQLEQILEAKCAKWAARYSK